MEIRFRSLAINAAMKSLLLALFLVLTSCTQSPGWGESVVILSAQLETEPVQSSGDAADDPAIWLHPHDQSKSLVVGTDKTSGIEVYGLDGRRVQRVEAGLTNNVDSRRLPNPWPEGSALLAASNRTGNRISLFLMSPAGHLAWLSSSDIQTDLNEIYGLCLYAEDERLFAFVNDKDGRYQQWQLTIDRLGVENAYDDSEVRVDGELLREFAVSSQPEGCVADDRYRRLFIGVEDEGVRWIHASPDESTELHTLADVDGERLVDDIEGVDIVELGDRGYLIVSSQGNNTYALFDRLPPFDYRGSFALSESEDGAVDGTSDTDGLAVSSTLSTEEFPHGLVVVQDGSNTGPLLNQNFKLISWADIADRLGLLK